MKFRREDSPANLLKNGPLVPVLLRPPPEAVEAMRERRASAPQASAVMMVDTGADATGLHEGLAQALLMPPIRRDRVVGVSGRPELRPVYRLAVEIPVADHLRVANIGLVLDMFALPPADDDEAVQGLLGRDFLTSFRFTYDGHAGDFELVEKVAPRLDGRPQLPPRKFRR